MSAMGAESISEKGGYILVDTWQFSGIELRDNFLYRNDQLIEESYVLLTGGSPNQFPNLEKFMIGPDEYFVLGDNRDNSRDSRFFGAVPRENIEGLVVHLWYSSAGEFPVTFR